MRRAAKIDASQPEIVEELRKHWYVLITRQPTDLAISLGQNIWHFVECKPKGWKGYGKKQEKQRKFVQKHNIPILTTPEQAAELYARRKSL